MTDIDPAIWLTGASAVGCVALLLHWRPTILRVLVSVAIVYVFLQISAFLYWLPYYKDGGNGYLDDGEIWFTQSLVFNVLLMGVATVGRWLLRFRRTRA